MENQTYNPSMNNEKHNYNGIFLAGAISAFVIVFVFLIEMIVVIAKGFPPIRLIDWFSIFHNDRYIGLLRTFALDIIAVSLHVPFYLALYFILKETEKSYGMLVISFIFALIGVAVYLSTNTTFSMLFLSDQFYSTSSEIEKTKILVFQLKGE